jgi:hypothetical protein
MATDPKLLELAVARAAAATAEAELREISAEFAEAQKLVEVAVKQGVAVRIAAAKSKVVQIGKRRQLARAKFDAALKRVETLRKALSDATIPPLSADVPIVLFPIRLETRFRTTQSATELLIRIYPDDLHIDTHEPALTGPEIESGRRFWQQSWGPDGNELAAWNQLASRLGAPRAAWIAKTIEPKNLLERLAAGTNPEFSEPPRREAAWTRAPRTALLPDRWVALGYGSSGKLFTQAGATIPDVLAAGPSPELGTEAPPNPESMDPMALMDEGMSWLMDFEAAVKVGMAMRVPLPAGVPVSLTRLIVIGVKATMDSQTSQQNLAALFDAQHYTRSLGFIPRGLPTNNTGEAPSGYDRKDLGSERSFATERKAALFTPGSEAKANGNLVARAFGVAPDVFSHVWLAEGTEEMAARSMNASLWAATWGYFLTRRIAGTLTPDALGKFRRHFIDFVRGGGPLPPLRIGNQPYGLLPVTSLDRWQPANADDVSARAALVLRNLRDAFRRALSNVPRVSIKDPDQSLLTVLRQPANSLAYFVRDVLGPQFVDNYQNFIGTSLNAKWWEVQQQLAAPTVKIPGMPAVTLQGASLESPTPSLIGKMVHFSAPAPDTLLNPNYIQPLPDATLDQLRFQSDVLPADRHSLLYQLLRHSLLIDYADAARRIQVRAGVMSAADDPEPELIDMLDDSPTRTVWRQLDTAVAAITGAQKLSAFLENTANESNIDVLDLAETRTALRTLAGVKTGQLERLLPETLDTCSHRFDAWATSLATKRLDALRSRNPLGTFVGGYGWVEDLSPSTARTSEGFLHAPSMAHATTGAVLASAYLSHRNQTGPNPFVIDMSSDRVKVARQLIQGVRQGQPLAALLGYRIERALQEQKELRPHIAKLRKIAPLGNNLATPDDPVESIAANNVVHGIRILEMRRNKHKAYEALRTAVSSAHFIKIDAILQSIESTMDALGDVLMAENVYQVNRGNFSRAGFTVDAIARGQSVAEPEVLDTPRTGTAVSHRVLFFCAADAPELAAWPATNLQIRAAAEPRLNAVASQLLPDPAKVHCRAQYLHPTTGDPLPLAGGALFRELRLNALQLSPLDAVYMSSSRTPGERGELEQRLEFILQKTRPTGVSAESRVLLDYNRDPAWPADVVSFGQFQLIAAGVRRLFTLSRALTPGDLVAATEPAAALADLDEFSRRADDVATSLRNMRGPLEDLIANADTAPLNAFRDVLMRCCFLGVKTGVPVSAAGDSEEHRTVLASQTLSVLNDVLVGISKLDEAEADFDRDKAESSARLEQDLRRIRIVLGSEFQAVPRIIPADPAELSAAFGATTELQDGDPAAASTWLQRAARVRDPLNALGDALRNADVVMSRSVPITVAQLPFVSGERWVALPFADGRTVEHGRVSIVACGPVNLLAGQPVDAIVVDEWTEDVPNAHETTGVAFHFDQPGARPPQAVLIAVAPEVTKPWDLDTLESILLETLELSKLRAVDQDAMVELDHYLPALYFALNAAGHTVTTNIGAS